MQQNSNIIPLELASANAFLIRDSKNILIDTGLPLQRQKLLTQLGHALDGTRLDVILLTHHDIDHVGNLYAVQKEFGGTAWIDADDLPYASGAYHRLGTKHLLECILRPKPAKQLSAFPHAADSPARSGPIDDIQIIKTPGHTPGHTIFQYGSAIFTGDLFKVNGSRIIPMRAAMNDDHRSLADSMERLLKLPGTFLYPSHGNALEYTPEVKSELRKVMKIYESRI